MTEDSGDDRPHGDHGSMLDKTVNVEQEQNSNENVERLSQMMLEMKKTSDQQKEAIERITELIGKQKETRESVAKNAKDTFEEPDADMFSIITTICGSKIDVASRNWEILVEEINQHRIKDICIFIVKIEQVLHFGVIIPVVKKILFVTPDQKFEAIFHREISKRWTIHNLYFPKLKIDQTLVTYKLIQLWVRKYIDDEEMKRSLMGNRATYLSGIRSLFNTINEDDVEAYSLLIESRITSQISGKVTGAIMPNVTTNKSNEVTDEEKGKESNDHIIVGQLNPPQRRVEDDFGEWSDKINLYLESNRIPKSMWSNILYSTLNCQDRSAIDAERYLEGGFPHEYDEMMVFLAERSFKRHPVNEFYQFVRKEGVSVQMYFFRLEKIAKIAFNKKSEEERKQLIMSQFIRGIEDERISRKLFKMDRSNKCSLNQILRAAIEIEDEDLFVRKEPSCKWCERDICIQHQGYRKPQSENRRPGKEHVTHLLEIMDEEDSEGLWQGSGREHNAEVNLNVIREMYEDVHDCKLKNELNFTTVTHNGTTFEALIDSGSQRSVIAEHVRCKFDPIKTVHQNVQFLGFDNVGMSSMERVTVECYIGEEKIVNDFAVLNIGRYEMIIGNDILREKNMVIDHKNSKLIKLHNLSMDGDQSDNDDIVDSNDVSTLADRECIDREIVDVLEETGIIQPPESTPKIEHEIKQYGQKWNLRTIMTNNIKNFKTTLQNNVKHINPPNPRKVLNGRRVKATKRFVKHNGLRVALSFSIFILLSIGVITIIYGVKLIKHTRIALNEDVYNFDRTEIPQIDGSDYTPVLNDLISDGALMIFFGIFVCITTIIGAVGIIVKSFPVLATFLSFTWACGHSIIYLFTLIGGSEREFLTKVQHWISFAALFGLLCIYTTVTFVLGFKLVVQTYGT
ncbi:hypothetical protein SNEBB_007720 [Seison nebaliae]|nr:hypothetical protein SNEBB_007720 [Seison nebaliae]